MKNLDGLSAKEVDSQRKKYGENMLKEKKSTSWLIIFLRQFKSPLVYVLALASIISIIFSHFSDFWIIVAVVVVNSLIGAYQEFSAENTLSALGKMLKPKALVIREGKRSEILASELVPKDLAVLTAGDQVPADGKLLTSSNLVVDEKIFTGEDEPVSKDISKENNVYMGTKVLAGTAILEVELTGQQTKVGQISQKLSEIKEESTPLQKRLEAFSRNLIYVVAIIAVIIFISGILHGGRSWDVFELALILAVAAVPEGIPIATTVIMALGMRRILKRNGLVKNLLSVETLGSTSVICTDKTGTLTEGVMEVVRTDFSDQEKAHLSMILANQQKDGLEISLWQHVNKESQTRAKDLISGLEKIFEDPFDSEKKYSLVITREGEKEAGFILGAPEIVLGFCKLSDKEKEAAEKKIKSWAAEGLKVVGAAYKESGEIKSLSNWQWLGILGIDDPIRDDVGETIKLCRDAGIRVKIVTGDYLETALNVGKKLGFGVKDSNIIENRELAKLSEEELGRRIDELQIFARVTPDQKLRIVGVLQAKGEVVAMTGDGVNDVLALKKADIAVVVGGATDVAKETADLILLDSSFKTIYAACEEGRTILANIKKSIGYALSDSFVEMIVIFLAVILNFSVPITIAMILWINLICDGPNDILLGFEPTEPGIMKLSPKTIQKETIFDKLIFSIVVVISSSVGIISLFYFWYLQKIGQDLLVARTVVFASAAFASLVYIFTFKNLKKPLIEIRDFGANKYLFWGVASGLLLIIVAVYVPTLNNALGTKPLEFAHWLLIAAVGVISLFFVEILKLINNKNQTKKPTD